MDAFANSLASGVEGVVVRLSVSYLGERHGFTRHSQMKPIEGAESDGARGFFKGIGKGLVG